MDYKRMLLIISLSVAIVTDDVTAGFLPDYRHDNDMELNVTGYDIISQIRELNQYKPMRCRTDLCSAIKEYDKHKGTFYWPEAVAGYRVFVRCPFSVFEPIYAYRDCVVDESNLNTGGLPDISLYNISWTEAVIQNCPGPPLEQILNKWKNSLNKNSALQSYAVAISEVDNITEEYIDQPVTYVDINNIIRLIYKTLMTAIKTKTHLSLDTAKKTFNLIGYTIDYNKKQQSISRSWKFDSYRNRLLKCATLLADMLYPEKDSIYFIGKHVSLASVLVTGERQVIEFDISDNMTSGLPMTFELNATDVSYAVNLLFFGYPPLFSDMELSPSIQQQQQQQVTTVNTTTTKTTAVTTSNTSLSHSDASTFYHRLQPDGRSTNHNIEPQELPQEGQQQQQQQPLTTQPQSEQQRKRRSRQQLPQPSPLTEQQQQQQQQQRQQSRPQSQEQQVGISSVETLWFVDGRTISANGDEAIHVADDSYDKITGTVPLDRKLVPLRPLGGIAYVTVRQFEDDGSRDRSVTTQMEDVNTSVTFTSDSRDGTENHELRCVRSEPSAGQALTLPQWSASECSRPVVIGSGLIRCQCRTQGFVAIFSSIPLPEFILNPKMDDIWSLTGEREGATFLEFLGFPYHVEVYITSHVLRVLSLICLLATVVSYAVHKKAHRGTPTKILLQLCYSLLCLQLMMYITEAVAGTEWGCRVSNAIRYYLIMVSLMWNAVEAVNMYMMLVRVFNSDISRFVSKAAAIAWGMPLIGTITVLAVNKRGFDGTFDESCIFRCRLAEGVLYFAYLLPMAAILLHNTIIFALVLRVLLRQDKARPTVNRRTNWVRLVGAASMMVLLGVPWLFSAFGAIDATDDDPKLAMVEGVFQVVFIVLMDLQGVFIFLFHCARNELMRRQWRSTFYSGSAPKYIISSIRQASESALRAEKPAASFPLKYHLASKCPEIWSSDGSQAGQAANSTA